MAWNHASQHIKPLNLGVGQKKYNRPPYVDPKKLASSIQLEYETVNLHPLRKTLESHTRERAAKNRSETDGQLAILRAWQAALSYEAGICIGISSVWSLAFARGEDECCDLAKFPSFHKDILQARGACLHHVVLQMREQDQLDSGKYKLNKTKDRNRQLQQVIAAIDLELKTYPSGMSTKVIKSDASISDFPEYINKSLDDAKNGKPRGMVLGFQKHAVACGHRKGGAYYIMCPEKGLHQYSGTEKGLADLLVDAEIYFQTKISKGEKSDGRWALTMSAL